MVVPLLFCNHHRGKCLQIFPLWCQARDDESLFAAFSTICRMGNHTYHVSIDLWIINQHLTHQDALLLPLCFGSEMWCLICFHMRLINKHVMIRNILLAVLWKFLDENISYSKYDNRAAIPTEWVKSALETFPCKSFYCFLMKFHYILHEMKILSGFMASSKTLLVSFFFGRRNETNFSFSPPSSQQKLRPRKKRKRNMVTWRIFSKWNARAIIFLLLVRSNVIVKRFFICLKNFFTAAVLSSTILATFYIGILMDMIVQG